MNINFKPDDRIRIRVKHHEKFDYTVVKYGSAGLILHDLNEIRKGYDILTTHCISDVPLKYYLDQKLIEIFDKESGKWQSL